MKRRWWITVLAMAALVLPGATSLNSDSSTNDNPFSWEGQEANESPEAVFFCPSINNVAAFESRIHLRCSVDNGGILYYAFATDPAHVATADQILAIGNTAFVLGRGIWLYYNSDPGLNPPGCNVSDCRGLTGVSMV